MEAMKVSKRKGGDSGCHPSAPELLVVQCSSAVLDDGGCQGESVTAPVCTPWTYSNAYGCALNAPATTALFVVRYLLWQLCIVVGYLGTATIVSVLQ